MWMLISWALRRRPRDERPGLVEAALAYQPDHISREVLQTMSVTLGQTLEEWAEQRGIERGQTVGFRRLLCRALENRFGSVPDDLRQRIEETTDTGVLEQSILQCPNLHSLEELEI
jgi:hypothetical protein